MASVDSKSGKVKYHLGGIDLKKEQHIPNPKSQDGIPDLCGLTYLGEGNVVHNLECRYKLSDVRNRCYTSMTAKVLVAMNPYERQDANYTEDVMRAYQARPMNLEGLVGLDDLPPHVYTVANSAFLNMVARKKNQSIIVCGESGSGKTESAKYMMRFLAFTTTSTSLDPSEFAEADAIGQQVLDANPILESFGNAKTLINNNSSRFGKFTKMLFQDAKGSGAGGKKRKKLTGACIETYLLEKSRVVYQDKGERNYHIFYQLTHCHGNHPYLKLGPPEDFAYVNKSGCTELDDLRYPGKGADIEWNKELLHAFKTLLIPEDQMKSAFQKVAAILHLGNITFKQKSGEGSDVGNPEVMQQSAELFDVDLKGLQSRLETRTVYLPGDKSIIKPLNAEDALFNRDSMSRNLYNGLFRWIVWRINQQSAGDAEAAGTDWIGILDVFGFEIFENNSFEQFCINFANERLQQYFNMHVLQAEQDLYKREALLWDPIDLPNNQDCIDLVMSKPYGILPILDSTCVQPKGDDNVFVANLFNAHKYHPRLRRAKSRKVSGSKQMEAFNGFSVRHYAGEVIYNCANFLVKNSDSSEWDTVALFSASKNDITSKMLRMMADGKLDEDLKRSQKRAFLSTGSVFSDQLVMLMTELQKTQPYFVRCIKPNPNKEPKHFIQDFVRPQLRCGGLIEALRIIKLGFPTRCAYTRVYELFGSVLKSKPVVNLNLRDFTEAIMKTLGNQEEKLAHSDYQLGLTMVFFRPGKQEYLTNILDKKADQVSADKCREIRKFLIHKRWVRARGSIKAWIRTGQMLQEMRFKKAAISMVIIYRAVGRTLNQARSLLGGKREEEEALKRMRDVEYQLAMAAKAELAKLQELKKQQDAQLAKMQQDFQSQVNEKDEAIAAQNAKLEEAKKNLKELQQKIQDSESKRLAVVNESKAKISDLEAKLAAEQEAMNSLKRDQVAAQERAENLEIQLEKSRNANDDLRRSMGLGSAEYEKQIAEKDRLIAELRDRVRVVEEQLRATKEQMDSSVRDLNEQLEQARNDARAEQDRLEGMVRERDSQISRLQSELTLTKTSSEQKIKDQEALLEEAREELRTTRDKLSKQLSTKDNELNDAKRDLALAEGKLEASAAALAEAEKRGLAGQEDAQVRLNELKEKYDREIKKLEGKMAEQKAEISIANDRVEAAKRELLSSQGGSAEKLGLLERQLKDKEQEAKELREELKRTQAKLEELQRTLGDKINSLQDDLSKERAKARDAATRFEKESWEKTNELQAARGEIAMIKDRLRVEKESADAASKSAQDTLAQERELAAQREAKLTADLTAKSDDLRETKTDFRNEKREWKAKAEKYERTIADLEAQMDAFHEQQQASLAKKSAFDKEQQQYAANAEAKAAKAEAKFQAQLEEMRNDYKELDIQLAQARAERQKAQQDRDMERDGFNEREAKYKEDIAKLKAEIDKVEREYITYKQEASDEVEQKISALQGQVALLQSLVDDLKSDKIESKERESALQDQLKEAVAQAGEARSALRALQSSHGSEVDKLRLALEATREKALKDAQLSREHDETQTRKLVERDAKITDLKAELQEAIDSELKAKEELRKQQDDVKQQMLFLTTRNQELETERKVWLKKQTDYEQKLSDATTKLGELNIQLSENEHKRNMGDSNKAEVEVLKAKLGAQEKALADRSKAFDRQVKVHLEEAKAERDALENDFKRQLKQRDEQAKAQNEAYKYKLQYLELSQKELKNERKRWQDKEKEFERTLIGLTGELRELRQEHSQAVELHEAFRAHVEAKEAARQAEASGWEIKKQSLGAEHELARRQIEVEKNARIAQLERELHKTKEELNEALDEIGNLTQSLELNQQQSQRPAQEERKQSLYSPSPYSPAPQSFSPTPKPAAAQPASFEEPAPAADPVAEPAPVAEPEPVAQVDAVAEAAPPADEAAPPAEAPAGNVEESAF